MKTKKIDFPIELPEKTSIVKMSFTLMQDMDTCGVAGESANFLKMHTEWVGKGSYAVIKTKRWALDDGEMEVLNRLADAMVQAQEATEEDIT